MYHFCYDDKWRIVGTWRGTDTDPKELFIYHAAGVAGYGGSSYIDSVVLRDRDNSAKWSQAADGTLETRHYYAQNWRADVSAIFDNAGAVIEWQKYSAYGVPFLLTPGDHNKNGAIAKDDQDAFDADYAANSPRADLNRDGAWTTADQTLFTASYNAAAVGGRWKLSANVANRKGYAGYEHEGFGNDLAAPELAHVRHRVLHFGLGRWTRRDPLGYVDGRSLYAYTRSSPIRGLDPMGLVDQAGPGGNGCGSSRSCGVVHQPPTRTIWPFPGDPMLVPDWEWAPVTPTPEQQCRGSTTSTTTCTEWEDVVTTSPITIDVPRNGCSGSCKFRQRETYTPTRTCTTVTVCDADPSLTWSTSTTQTGTPRQVDGAWGYGTWTGCWLWGFPPLGCQCCAGSGTSLSCTKCIAIIRDRPGRRL
ncbi:MAG: hypothetical protein KF699_16795 [Phycisphaeraceae bacterium]|nr:hypothetical protein [Phycisphaeraceae bacterium]